MWKLNFRILKKKWNARVWTINLNGIQLPTPVFMPVGTKATVKWILPDILTNTDMLGSDQPVNIILNNTFHLYLRPWDDIVKLNWGLHKFQNRDRLILTDSWGFQVFSLWDGNKNQSMVQIQDDWVWFRSPLDGDKIFFSPSKVVDIQMNLGSDIMMVLDVCSSVHDITKDEVAQQMHITHDWATQAFNYFEDKYNQARGVLFPIIQWWVYEDLRAQSAEYLSKYARDGIAIWGLSVGETKQDMYRILHSLSDKLPDNKPRYLMWVGTPQDIREAIYAWIDMFDCVLPTRMGRHWAAFSGDNIIKLKNAEYQDDLSTLDADCSCYVCQNFTKSYLSHLVRQNEMLWATLLSLHNIAYLHRFVAQIRQEIMDD